MSQRALSHEDETRMRKKLADESEPLFTVDGSVVVVNGTQYIHIPKPFSKMTDIEKGDQLQLEVYAEELMIRNGQDE